MLVVVTAMMLDTSPFLAKFLKWNEKVFKTRLHDSNPLFKLVQLHILLRRSHVVLVDILDGISTGFVILDDILASG